MDAERRTNSCWIVIKKDLKSIISLKRLLLFGKRDLPGFKGLTTLFFIKEVLSPDICEKKAV